MAANDIPVTVPGLVAHAADSAARMRKHRDAMRDVAAQVRADTIPQDDGEVN